MRVITRDQYTLLPTPMSIINRINDVWRSELRQVQPRRDYVERNPPVADDGGIAADDIGAVRQRDGQSSEPPVEAAVTTDPEIGDGDSKQRIGLHITVRAALRSRGTAALESIFEGVATDG